MPAAPASPITEPGGSPQAVKKTLQPAKDDFDGENFNAVAYINEMFPSGQKYNGLNRHTVSKRKIDLDKFEAPYAVCFVLGPRRSDFGFELAHSAACRVGSSPATASPDLLLGCRAESSLVGLDPLIANLKRKVGRLPGLCTTYAGAEAGLVA